MKSDGSVTRWIGQVKAGEEEGAEALWTRYFSQLVHIARRKLKNHPRRVADEEDVALSAFDSFCRGARDGRFPKLQSRDNLWRLLIVITARKATHLRQYGARKKRDQGRMLEEAAGRGGPLPQIDQVIGNEPTPEFALLLAEEYEQRLHQLDDDRLRGTALLKMEGYKNEEIADQMDCSVRTVERRLAGIRSIWSEDYLHG